MSICPSRSPLTCPAQKVSGSEIVSGMEMAALSRKAERERKPFYLFLDEFQDFCANDGAAKTLAQILSECRKFGLHLHLAHQTLGQVRERVSSALGNVGVKVVFSIDREDAEVMAKKLFSVNSYQVKHPSQTDTQHPMYSSLPEQWEAAVRTIQELPARRCLVKQRGHKTAQIKTETIKPYKVSSRQVDELISRLAKLHGQPPIKRTGEPPTGQAVNFVDWNSGGALPT